MRYPLIQRLLHWSIAVVVLGTLAVGLTFSILDGFQGTKDTFGGAVTGLLYKYHKTFGLVILFAMLVRVIVKARLGKPEYTQALTPFERTASKAVHGLFYVLLLASPVLGWFAMGAGGFPVQFFEWNLPQLIGKDEGLYAILMEIHGICGWLILLLILAHVGGALKHWLIDKDGVMGRMRLF